MPQPHSGRTLIDDCVHCGFCLPHCPTYVSWGEEMDSPRGRIVLMKGLAEGTLDYSDTVVGHFDRWFSDEDRWRGRDSREPSEAKTRDESVASSAAKCASLDGEEERPGEQQNNREDQDEGEEHQGGRQVGSV